MALSGCDFKKQNLEKNKLQKDIYTTIKGGKLPPLMVVDLSFLQFVFSKLCFF